VLLFLEIGMLLVGFISLVWRDVPKWLFGGSQYRIPDQTARLLGMVLLLPIPLTALTGFIYSVLFGEGFQRYAFWLELLTVLATMAVAVRVTRIARRPIEEDASVSEGFEEVSPGKQFERKVQVVKTYAALVGLGLPAIAFYPTTIHRANETLALMEQAGSNNTLKEPILKARRDASILLSLWGLAFIGIGVLSSSV
jgi:hypothetical protein